MPTERFTTFAGAINEALTEEMERDSTIFIMGEDVATIEGRWGTTVGMIKKFGKNRIIDTPINEELFLGVAMGAAQTGMRPIIEFCHGTLPLISASDIFRMGMWKWIGANKFDLPIVVRVKLGTGFTHLGPELSSTVISPFLNLLGIKMVAPSTPYQAKGLFKTALRGNDPIIFFEHVSLYSKLGEVPALKYALPLNLGEFRKRGGSLSLLSYSNLTDIAEEAARELVNEGIDIEILDLVSLKPLDKNKILETAKKTKKIIVLDHEAYDGGGLFATIYTLIKKEMPDAYIIPLTTKPMPIPFGSQEEHILIYKSRVVMSVKEICQSIN